MEKKEIIFKIAGLFFIAMLIGIFTAPLARAYVASSTNFMLETDIVSYGGGLSSSTNFMTQDSLSDRILGDFSATTGTFAVKSGYIPQVSSSISVSFPSTLALSPAISADSGGQGNGTASVVVITDNSGGYSLSIKASTDPALSSGSSSFADYSPAISGTPDFTWSVGASDSRFGFSPEGTDINAKYKDNGTSCNVGALDTSGSCWDGISTTSKTIAGRTSPTIGGGITTTVKFRSEAGSSRSQPAGSYSANITFTALAL